MPSSSLRIVVLLGIEVLIMLPLIAAEDHWPALRAASTIDVLAIVCTISYFEYVAWNHSKFVFCATLPLFAVVFSFLALVG